jgi:dihydrolipoamide dehydrogenase
MKSLDSSTKSSTNSPPESSPKPQAKKNFDAPSVGPAKSKGLQKFVILALLIAAFIVFFQTGAREYLSLKYVQSQLGLIQSLIAAQPVLYTSIFFGVYVVSTALSFPGATILTLLAGALFGTIWGTVLVSVASTLGATLAFWGARFLFYDSVQKKFGSKLQAFNEGFKKDGTSYLLTLRLVPIFPFFLINLLMGLTPISTWSFFIWSQIGMLPGTAIYVNAGKELSQIQSLKGIISPGIIVSLVILGIFPLFIKSLMSYFKAQKLYRRFSKPKKFDYNIVVIGAGSAGLVTSYIAAAIKAKVALIEKHKMGGDCLNTGCVPSKALIRSARFVHELNRAQEFGMKSAKAEFDFAEIMQRVQTVIQKIEPHDSVERYTQLGVECIRSTAKIISPFEVEVDGRTLTAKNIVIATGARPRALQIDGINEVTSYTSDTIWSLRIQPKHLLVVGGGPIGCELAQAFSFLGSKVTIIDAGSRIMPREDLEVSVYMTREFEKAGIKIYSDSKILKFRKSAERQSIHFEKDRLEQSLEFDCVLLASGREANVKGFGLEALGVEIAPQGTIAVDGFLRTNYPNIYACGDVVGPYQFTHAAAHQAWYTAVNALFSPFKKFSIDYRVMPWSTFTTPEVARVGLSEDDAKKKNIAFEVSRYGLDDLDRAIADSSDEGFVKVLTVPGKDQILGVTIVGDHASEMLPEFITAMKYNLGLNKILGTIHSYPTMSEANKYVAGIWKKAHAPKKALQILEKFHAWRRG